MTASSLSPPISQRGWFDVLDDWLKRDRFVFVGWSGLLLFPTAYLAIGGSLLALRLSQVGTPTVSQVVTWRVLISLQRLCQRLLMLWVILFFYFGVLSLSDFIRWCQLGGASLCCSPRCLCSDWFHASSVRTRTSYRNQTVQCYCVFWAYRCFCQCVSHLSSRTVLLVLCAVVWCCCDF